MREYTTAAINLLYFRFPRLRAIVLEQTHRRAPPLWARFEAAPHVGYRTDWFWPRVAAAAGPNPPHTSTVSSRTPRSHKADTSPWCF